MVDATITAMAEAMEVVVEDEATTTRGSAFGVRLVHLILLH